MKRFGIMRSLLGALLLFFATFSFASLPSLSESERSMLRYRLENLYNEFDLLIRNHKTDVQDLKKQVREAEALKMYERVPFNERRWELERELKESAGEAGLRVHGFALMPGSASELASVLMPRSVSLRNGYFEPMPEQIVKEIHFKMTVQGSKDQILKWTQSWKDHLMRLTQFESMRGAGGAGQLVVLAHAYQFRDVKYPKLIPTPPQTLLPVWAQKNTKALSTFAKAEPVLWSFVTRAESLLPLTPGLYETRREFLLNAARMDFFIARAK